MIAADFLGDPTGTIARSSITAPVTATSISIVHSDPLGANLPWRRAA
jgi:hypothetical protein